MTEEEKQKLQDEIARLEDLIDKVESIEEQTKQKLEEMNKVSEGNVKTSDKTSIQNTIDELKRLLEEFGDNMTPEEIARIKDEIARLEQLLKDIQEIEQKTEAALGGKINITIDNVKTTDKDTIQNAIDYINGLLSDPKNLTPEQIELLKAELDRLQKIMDKINELQSLLDKALTAPTDVTSAQELIDLINKLLSEYGDNLTDEQKAALMEMLEKANAIIEQSKTTNTAGSMFDKYYMTIVGVVASLGALAVGTSVVLRLRIKKRRNK